VGDSVVSRSILWNDLEILCWLLRLRRSTVYEQQWKPTNREIHGFTLRSWEEDIGLDVAPSALEASNQLRRSPNSSNGVFRAFGIVLKSATQI